MGEGYGNTGVKRTGTKQIVDNLVNMKFIGPKVGMVFLRAVASHVVMRAEKNAPIKEDKLRPQIKFRVTQSSPTLCEAVVSSSAMNGGIDYAVLMHEHQMFRGSISDMAIANGDTVTPVIYGFGKRTKAQPMTPEGGAGGKYITRVVWYHYRQYLALFNRMFLAALNGKDWEAESRSIHRNA